MWEASHSYGGASFCVVVMVFEKSTAENLLNYIGDLFGKTQVVENS